jgi:membrane protein implicated in regulation of membrane protease activity
METWNFVGWQFAMTFIAVLAIAIFLFMRVRRSQQRRGEEPGKISVPKPPQR